MIFEKDLLEIKKNNKSRYQFLLTFVSESFLGKSNEFSCGDWNIEED